MSLGLLIGGFFIEKRVNFNVSVPHIVPYKKWTPCKNRASIEFIVV
jgi:hypothetical protein